MKIIKNFIYSKCFIDDFLKSFSILSIALFFKTALPNLIINDILIILVLTICFINLIKIFINLILSLREKSYLIFKILFLSSLISSIFRTSSLYFARIIQSKPGLLWNVDLGFTLTHSQNVLRYGSLKNSLTMSGFPEAYHIGPSYIYGILGNYFRLGIDILSLLILPTIFFCVFIFASQMIVDTLLNNKKYVLFISSLICFTPGLFLKDPNLSNVLNSSLTIKDFAYNLPFQFSSMQNSMFAGSAIVCIFYFLIKSFKKNIYLIFSTSLSLYAIKPLYFVSAFLFIILFLILLVTNKNYSVLINNIKFKNLFKFRNFLFLTIIFFIWFYFYKFKLISFYDSSFSLYFFKDIYNLFNAFSFDNLKDLLKIPYRSFLDLPLIGSSVFLILVIIKFNKLLKLNICEIFFINYSIILYLMSFTLSFLSVAISLSYKLSNPETIAFSEKLGNFPNIYGEYLINQTQASYPLYTLVTILGISCIASTLNNNYLLQSSLLVNLKKIFLSIIILLNAIHTNFLITKNNYVDTFFRQNDEINASSYYKLIKEIPLENSLLLTNSVENGYYGRTFRNTYLTAFTGHDHFLANISDYHWRSNSNETLKRLEIYYQIFPNNINLVGIYNPDSIEILRKSRITHLILQKLPSKKNILTYKGLQLLKENDKWILYKVIK